MTTYNSDGTPCATQLITADEAAACMVAAKHAKDNAWSDAVCCMMRESARAYWNANVGEVLTGRASETDVDIDAHIHAFTEILELLRVVRERRRGGEGT